MLSVQLLLARALGVGVVGERESYIYTRGSRVNASRALQRRARRHVRRVRSIYSAASNLCKRTQASVQYNTRLALCAAALPSGTVLYATRLDATRRDAQT